MLNRYARAFFTAIFTPTARFLLRMGVSPDVVTLVGTLGVCVGALAFFPRGELFWGTMFITAFVFTDLIDGTMARMSDRVTSWGAFLDSTLDRIGDAAIFGGLVLAERLVAVLVTTGFVGLGLPEWVLTAVLALLAVASLVTVVQRMLSVRTQARQGVSG